MEGIASETAPMSELPYYWPSQIHGNVIEVIVGPYNKSYSIHREVVINRCSYFKACLSNNQFQEAATNQIRLPDVMPSAFELVVSYIYTGTLFKVRNIRHGHISDDHIFVRAYALAGRFCMEALQNAIIDRVRAFYYDYQPSIKAIGLLKTDAINETAIYWLIIDNCAFWMSRNPRPCPILASNMSLCSVPEGNDNIDGEGEEQGGRWELDRDCEDPNAPYWALLDEGSQLARALVTALQAEMKGTFPDEFDKCFYHVHKETPQCTGRDDNDGLTRGCRGMMMGEGL